MVFTTNHSRFLRLSLVSLWLSIACQAHAVRYELAKGHQYELCRDYVAALNAANQSLPMACEREFPPEFDKFDKPRWTPMDPTEQPEEFYRQIYYVWRETVGKFSGNLPDEEGWQLAWERQFKPKIEAGAFQLDRARVDVVSSGERVTLVRFAFDSCANTTELFEHEVALLFSTYRYVVIDEETGKPHKGYSMLTSRPRQLFYYKGRAFMDNFIGPSFGALQRDKSRVPQGFITVQEPGGRIRPVDEYRKLFESGLGFADVCTVRVHYEWDAESKNNDTSGSED